MRGSVCGDISCCWSVLCNSVKGEHIAVESLQRVLAEWRGGPAGGYRRRSAGKREVVPLRPRGPVVLQLQLGLAQTRAAVGSGDGRLQPNEWKTVSGWFLDNPLAL